MRGFHGERKRWSATERGRRMIAPGPMMVTMVMGMGVDDGVGYGECFRFPRLGEGLQPFFGSEQPR